MAANNNKKGKFDKKAELQKHLEKTLTTDKGYANCWLVYKRDYEIVTKMEREYKKQEKEKNMRVHDLKKQLQLACKESTYGLLEETAEGRERLRQLATFRMGEAHKLFSKLNKEQLSQLAEEEKECASKQIIPTYPYGFKKGDILRYEKDQIENAARDLVNHMTNNERLLYQDRIKKLENLFVGEAEIESEE